MNAIRLTIRFFACIVGIVILPVTFAAALMAWGFGGDFNGFKDFYGECWKNLTHPFTS